MKLARPSLLSYPDYVGMLDLYYSRNPLIRHYFWGRLSRLLSLTSWNETDQILEIGFGPGVLLPTLINLSNNVVGIGPESLKHLSSICAMLKNEQINHKVNIMNGDACKLPFKDESFDAVIAADVLEHIEEIMEALREIRRVLKNGGHLLTCVPIESGLRRLLRRTLGYRLPRDLHTHIKVKESITQSFHVDKICCYPKLPKSFLLIKARKQLTI